MNDWKPKPLRTCFEDQLAPRARRRGSSSSSVFRPISTTRRRTNDEDDGPARFSEQPLKATTGLRHVGVIYFILSLAGGVIGYFGHAFQAGTTISIGSHQIPSLDYFYSPKSFSEVENTKAMMEALSSRYLAESRRRLIVRRLERAESGESVQAQEELQLKPIRQLERGIEEFRGTEQELVLIKELLWCLKSISQYDRWLDVYLRTLYQHPTHELVGRLAKDAVVIGQASGRSADVSEALRFVAMIPLEFSGKVEVQLALEYTADRPQIVQNGRGNQF